MQLSKKALNGRWAVTSVAAVVVLMVLYLADSALRFRTGYGTFDLQGIGTGWGLRRIMDHWTSPPDAALAGFDLGLDYLFMPIYAAALYFGSVAALVRFAPKPGAKRRLMALLAVAPIAAALCDACENAIHILSMINGPTDALAALAARATMAKFAGLFVGLTLTLLAIGGLFVKKSEEAADSR